VTEARERAGRDQRGADTVVAGDACQLGRDGHRHEVPVGRRSELAHQAGVRCLDEVGVLGAAPHGRQERALEVDARQLARVRELSQDAHALAERVGCGGDERRDEGGRAMDEVLADRHTRLVGRRRVREARAAAAVVVQVDETGQDRPGSCGGRGDVRPARGAGVRSGPDPRDQGAVDDDDAVLEDRRRGHDTAAQVQGLGGLAHGRIVARVEPPC
jgi:hypothetical protein